jgi:DNA repair photolyase
MSGNSYIYCRLDGHLTLRWLYYFKEVFEMKDKKLNKEEKQQTALFGTKEWSDYSINCVSGCSHDCKYCYAKSMAIRFKRHTPENWENEIINSSILAKGFKKSKEGKKFMFPTSHDITPSNLSACIQRLTNLLTPGNEGIIVTKPHFECIEALCEVFPLFKDKIVFRFTIGSSNSDTLRFWEPEAPNFEERLASLKYAHWKGYQTSVSCEPMLDDNVKDVLEWVLPYVTETVWIGKPNMLKSRLSMNGHKDEETMGRADRLMQSLSDQSIWDLYNKYKVNPKIRWKDSIKKVVEINGL